MLRRSRSPVMLMALTVFIDLMGFGIILPLLPFWAEKLHATPFQVGLILTIYVVAQFLCTPLLGSLSDRYGRKPIIVVSLLIEAAAFALTALAGSLVILFIARFIGGMGSSNIGSAQAVVADVTPPQERARGMGLIGAAIGMGFVVGPALGGILAKWGEVVPFWAALGVALVNALLVVQFLPETHKRPGVAGPASVVQRRHSRPFGGWQRTLRSPVIARVIAVNLLFTLAFTAMEAVFPLFSQRRYGWDAIENGYVFTYVGIVIVVMQGGLVGRLVKRFGEHAILLSGLAMLAVGLLLLPVSRSLALLLAALAILSVGEGAVTPTTSALLSLASPAHAQGETLGVAQGISGLGRILGTLAAGAVFSVGLGLPFAAGGVIILLALLVALPRFPMRPRTHASHEEAQPATFGPTVIVDPGQAR